MFVENIDEFLSTADFAIAVTIGGSPVNAIFDDAYQDDLEVEGSVPTLWCKTAALPAIAHGTAVVVNSVSYRISGIQPDGTGVTVLRLQRT